MSHNKQELLRKVIEHVFNNWSALQIAVEHQMGGSTSRQTAIDAINWVTEYCLSHLNMDADKLTEALEDILDEEYEVICADGSPRQVAHVLLKFLGYINEGNLEMYETEFNNLPTCHIWLSQPREPRAQRQVLPVPPVPMLPVPPLPILPVPPVPPSSNPSEMDVDPEWTVVNKRRRK